MSSKSSCPTECGPRGDIIPTLKTDEEQEVFSLKHLPHYSCFKSVETSDDKVESEQPQNTSGGPDKEVEDTSCNITPQKETENVSYDLSEKEVAEGEQTDDEEQTEEAAAVKEGGDHDKQKSKEIDHSSSLFNIADAKSNDVDYQNSKPFDLEIPAPNSLASPLTGGAPNMDMLVKGPKNRSQKSPGTKSPAKSPRELLQSVQLPPAASQQIYDDHGVA